MRSYDAAVNNIPWTMPPMALLAIVAPIAPIEMLLALLRHAKRTVTAFREFGVQVFVSQSWTCGAIFEQR